MSGGMTIVAAGFGRQALDLAALLNPADRSSPRIQMVCAYAHYTMGRYDQIVISEAPDDETVAKVTMMVAGRGNVATETVRAFTMDEVRKLI